MDNEFIPFAHQLADAAGAAIRPFFGQHGAVETKKDSSPVTQADRAAEAAIRALIAEHYPDHGIYGEELGITAQDPQSTNHDYTWVIDPIDGTRDFIAGGTQWGTLIALCENGVPVLGILDQPITGERWVGVKDGPTIFYHLPLEGGGRREAVGGGATMPPDSNTAPPPQPSPGRGEGAFVRTRACPNLASATISTTSKNHFTPEQAMRFVKLAEQCAEAIDGGDCYAYGMLARGARDMVVDSGLKPYDILALAPIIEGAGGKITAWDGAPITLSHYATALACGDAALHAEALAALT